MLNGILFRLEKRVLRELNRGPPGLLIRIEATVEEISELFVNVWRHGGYPFLFVELLCECE